MGLSIAIGPGEAFYFPLAHRAPVRAEEGQVGLGFDDLLGDAGDGAAGKRARARKVAEPTSIAGRALAQGAPPPLSLPSLDSADVAPLRAFLEDPAVNKTAHDAKYAILLLRRSGVTLRGLDFDTTVASYVLDPGRRSHALDQLALEFLDRKTTSFEELCGKAKEAIPFDEVPVACARDYACERADVVWRLRERFEPQLDELQLARLFHDIEKPSTRTVSDDGRIGFMGHDRKGAETTGRILKRWRAATSTIRFCALLGRSSTSTPTEACGTLFDSCMLAAQEDRYRRLDRRELSCKLAAKRDTGFRCCCWNTAKSQSSRARVHRRAAALRASDDAAGASRSDDRRDRPAVVERPEPAEYPHPP